MRNEGEWALLPWLTRKIWYADIMSKSGIFCLLDDRWDVSQIDTKRRKKTKTQFEQLDGLFKK